MKRYEQVLSMLLLFVMAALIMYGLYSLNRRPQQGAILTAAPVNTIAAEQ